MAGREHKPYPIVIRRLEVLEAFDVTPGMRRIVLTGDELGAFRNNGHDIFPFRTENADDHVKLVVLDGTDIAPPAQDDGHLDWSREALARARDYTPRRYDAAARRLELDFVRHEGGLAAEWADRVRPGDRVHVAGPRGTTVLPPDIDWYFLAGDETALPAIARRVEELPAGTPVTAVVSVPSASEEQTFEHAADLDITWVHRDTAGPGAFMAAVRAAPWRDGQVYAWAAGEAGMLRPFRRWLKEDRPVDPGHTDISGYWRAGRSQDQHAKQLAELRRTVNLGVPYAVRAAISLGLAEHVSEGRTTVDALAEATGARPGGIRRLVGLLAFERLFTVAADGTVGLGPKGYLLLEEYVHSMLDDRFGHARLDHAWPGLLHAVRTGRSGFEHVKGHSFWDELASEANLGESFDRTLAEWSGDWAPKAVEAMDLTDEHVVDVGGGSGTLLGHVLSAFPGTRGTLVELPTTAARAEAHLADVGVGDRTTIARQSFFEKLPGGGDVYLLAQVLHDWPDEEAVAVLGRAAEAAGSGGRVLVIERLSEGEARDHDAIFDLKMYAVFGSGERTEDEYAALAARAGLRPGAVARLHGAMHMIEMRAADPFA
ncbi:siderophore-interacting protein [Actinomadura sp. WMMB 499]|uniref:siderophore-interacting protein n=1 Tax=Actinomadura sp. WMMB 499 TaxID=1219491 RepID=UPI0012444846|nr:siderophore-interacting protein [Actinomadura sp. WMMB 499]QFG20202.1 siderophore-interacting protein [Actinomadura sp. WMMB 499]